MANSSGDLDMARDQTIEKFLEKNGYGGCRRTHMTGDASSRAYELIECANRPPVLLMNAPAQPDGPPIRDGKPYSQIARLAEDMRAFAGIALLLERHGFRVPAIHAQDLDEGLLLIENLGSVGVVTQDGEPILERYAASMETLAEIHETRWEQGVQLADGSWYAIPRFDREVLLIEVDLMAQWYIPYRLGREMVNAELEEFNALWSGLALHLDKVETSLMLRDFHSPNILWMEGKQGVGRTALIDFQDALIGPSAYDVASLAQDARIDVTSGVESQLLDHYLRCRRSVDEELFRQTYAILAAQRATKILGIFVRLSKRDGKHGYLKHLPRVEAYLQRSMQHAVLADFKGWFHTLLQRA